MKSNKHAPSIFVYSNQYYNEYELSANLSVNEQYDVCNIFYQASSWNAHSRHL